MSNLKKAFGAIKNYFDLSYRGPVDDDFSFVIEAKLPERAVGQKLKDYFGLVNIQYIAADKVAQEIMSLANTEGVAKGRFFPAGANHYGYSFSETNADGVTFFRVKLEGDGKILLKCDAAFAEKVQKLASVSSIQPIVKKSPQGPSPTVSKEN
jgi:hypothetical protein